MRPKAGTPAENARAMARPLHARFKGSIIGSGISGLPQTMVADAGAGAILIGWTGNGMRLVRVCQSLLASGAGTQVCLATAGAADHL